MANQSIDARTTVNDVLRAFPQAISVFTSFGIDACCGGSHSLAEAARRHGVERAELLAVLHAITLPRTERPHGVV